MKISDDWEFNVLDIYNYKRPGSKRHYFDFIIENHAYMAGDIIEAGVFRGRSLLATGLLLKELGSAKKVYGFDSFSGFPPIYQQHDDLSTFETLHGQGKITAEHLLRVKKLQQLRAAQVRKEISTANISKSGDFSDNTLQTLRQKIALLELDNIEIVQGPFEQTMTPAAPKPEKVMAALFDCDLYQSYQTALPFVWPRLETGGYLFLDEYYSLKFPGARIATDEYFADKADKPRRHTLEPGDFERWYVRKYHIVNESQAI